MNSKQSFKLGTIITAGLGTLIYTFSQPVIVQPQSYHLFADQRAVLGIPNGMDVLSNFFFLLIGVLGLREVLGQLNLVTRASWKWFFLSIALIAPGSAYYHWSPNDATLVWDRLPMSMGFMALYIVILSEHISIRTQKFLFPGMLTGVLSVLVWVLSGDLRFYFWVQFSSFITIPLILVFYPSRYSLKILYPMALGLYALAKVAEAKDGEIFQASQYLLSGHTLKHLLSASGLGVLWVMVKVRRERSVAVAAPVVPDTAIR